MNMPDDDLRSQLSDLSKEVGDLKGTVRVVKHDVANMQQAQVGFGTKLEKVEDRLGAKIDSLSTQITAVNVKHERGFGFFAGMGFVIVSCGGLLLAVGKLLFGHQS